MRPSRTIPGGWRVVRSLGLVTDENAQAWAASYKAGSYQAMSEQELIDIRLAWIAEREESA